MAEGVVFGATSPAPAVSTLWKAPFSKWLGPEYVPLVQDVLRMTCIQAMIQVMVSLGSGGAGLGALFTSEFALLLIYVILGVMLYWLVVRRIVAIV